MLGTPLGAKFAGGLATGNQGTNRRIKKLLLYFGLLEPVDFHTNPHEYPLRRWWLSPLYGWGAEAPLNVSTGA